MSARLLALLVCTAFLNASCSVAPEKRDRDRDRAPRGEVDIDNIPDAVPRIESRSHHGNMDSYVVFGKRYYTLDSSIGFKQRGIASWYGEKFHGRKTSSGERYDMFRMTAAHKTLPLPTYVQVTNLRNGRSIIVRANDRGPFHDNRVIDLSYVAALKLDIVRTGTGLVEVVAIDPRNPPSHHMPVMAQVPVEVVPDEPTADTGKVMAQVQLIAEFPGVVHVPLATPDRRAQIFLQIGAFAARTSAERVLAKLADVKLPGLRIAEASHRERTLYRVQVGPFDDVNLLDGIARVLADAGYGDQHVIIE